MGFDNSTVQLLCAARNRGVEFGEVGTLGRQSFFPSKPALDRVLKALGASPEDVAALEAAPGSDAFLRILGARRVDAIDYSAYENAAIIQDLNGPLAPELRNRFDVLIDGGTIEHVFNAPQALKSAMQMVRVGGWFIQVTVANNLLGHGFWQISPELLFRCFSPENGFDPPTVLLKEMMFDDRWREARDPNEIGRRVELRNLHQTYICALARKREDVEPFASPPYQSDYVAAWSDAPGRGERPGPARKPWARRGLVRSLLPLGVRSALKCLAAEAGLATMYDPAQYRRIPLDAFLRGEFGGASRPPGRGASPPAAGATR